MKFLRPLRLERKLTQDYMAEAMGVTKATYHRMETVTSGMQLASLCRLKKVLGLTWTKLGEILEDEFLNNADNKGSKGTGRLKSGRG